MMNIKRALVFKVMAPLLAVGALLAPASSHAADVDADGIGDESDAVPCDPRASSVAFSPAKDQQGSLLFEDMWPAKGDLDFNDVALSYNYSFFLDDAGRVSSMQVSLNLLAAGGTIANSVRLHLPVAANAASTIELNGSDGVRHAVTPEANEHEFVISLIPDVNAALGDTLANTTTDKGSVPGVSLNLYIRFETPVALDLSQAPFDLYIERVNEPGHQIHQVGYAGTDTMDVSLFGTGDDGSTEGRHFIDQGGLPFALSVPTALKWPRERTSISTAYPDITPWATSGGAVHADWYESTVDSASVWTGGANGSSPPVGVVLGPTGPSEDLQCAPWKGSVQFGEAPYTYPYGTATDRAGSVIVVGETYEGNDRVAFVNKYDSHKRVAWTKTFAGKTPFMPSKSAEALGVATDSQNNIYVVGTVLGSILGEPYDQLRALGYERDSYVAKLDPKGNLLWVTHLLRTGMYLTAYAIAVAPDGTIDTTGGTAQGSVFIAQLDASGQLLAVKQSALRNAVAMGIATDPSGNMYVSGASNSLYSSLQTLVAKFSSSGNLLWSHVDHGSDYNLSGLAQVAVDAQGSAYVSGYRHDGQACGTTCYSCGLKSECCYNYCRATYDAPMWKFDTNGQQRWVTTVGTGSAAFATTIDAAGNPFYAGQTWVSLQGQPLQGTYDDFVTRVDPNTGAIVWLRQSGPNSVMATSMATDPAGSVFVSGLTNTDLDGNLLDSVQAYVSKYDPDGNQQ